jgi:hypothetical protein
MKKGPKKCLQDRLQETIAPPPQYQMINAASSRRTSFRQAPNTKPGLLTNATSESGKAGKLVGKASLPKPQQWQGKSARPVKPAEGASPSGSTSRRSSLPATSPGLAGPAPSVPEAPGSQTLEQAFGVPSLVLSEHDEDEELALAPSISLPSNRNQLAARTSPETRQMEQKPRLRQYPISETAIDLRSTVAQSHHLNRQQLSPLLLPQSNLRPEHLAPIDGQSDDSETESNHSNGGESATVGPPTRPDPKAQKLVWIHLAYNNPTWVSVSSVCLPQNSYS